MPSLFVDTAGWAAIIDKSQPQHALAVTVYRLAQLQNRSLVTTNYVLTELVACLKTRCVFHAPSLSNIWKS